MKTTVRFPLKPIAATAACLLVGVLATACGRQDGQMSDSAAADAPKQSATLTAALDDTAITAKVKTRLASDARTENAKIEVETNNGVVTLTGTAPSGDAKSAAEDLARNVETVRGVDNKIDAPTAMSTLEKKVETAADATGEAVTDTVITTKVKAAFADSNAVNASDIEVNTEGGYVTLEGTVTSMDARSEAVKLASNIDGVKGVDGDRLQVVAKG